MKLRRTHVLVVWFAFIVGMQPVFADGRVVGKVIDDKGGSVGGAVITVDGRDERTTTADDGTFSLQLPAGEHQLIAKAADYLPGPQAIEVIDGQELRTTIRVLPIGGNVVKTTTTLSKDTGLASIKIVKEAPVIREQVSQDELNKTNSGDAAAGTQRMPGVSVVGGKFAFVRGLGGRYSQTLFNSSSLPSPEPDQRVVPLDLFPSSIISQLGLQKTYSPDLPGEFAGGSVQINTIDVPREGFFKLGYGTTFRNGTTFHDFGTYEGSNWDAFTFQDGTRELPDAVPGTSVGGATPAQRQAIGRAFSDIWEADFVNGLPDHKLGGTFGQSWGQDPGAKLGVVGAFNWSNSYKSVRDEVYSVQINTGTLANPDPQVFNSFNLDTYTFSAELSGLLNLTFQMNPGNKVGIRNFFVRSTEDRVRMQEGFDGQTDRDIRVTQLRYVERALYNSQIFGEHVLVGDSLFQWRASVSRTERDEPDNRQVRYDYRENLGEFLYEDISGSGRRDFFFLEEDGKEYAFDYIIPFHLWVEPKPIEDVEELKPEQRLQFGLSFANRDRSFESRRFRFRPSTISITGPEDVFGNPLDTSLDAESLLQADSINPRGFILEEETRPTDNYDAEQDLSAAYGLFHLRLASHLRLQAGARVEKSEQTVRTFELFGSPPMETIAELNETDVLPAFTCTWEWTDNMQLRVAGSQTVSRPEFRELAEFQFTDISGGYSARGNPDLQRAIIRSLDLRWEWFPNPGEVITLAGFIKKFEDPIERVIIPTGSSLITTWENAKDADASGIEFELKKSLGIFGSWFEKYSFKANVAFIDTEVTTNPNSSAVQTNTSRKLQGQPEYTYNAGLFYDAPESGLSWGLIASSFGKRISAVGAFGVPDEEEQPRVDLDFTISKSIGQGSMRLTLGNILDEAYEFKQESTTTRKFKKGWTAGVSYSLDF